MNEGEKRDKEVMERVRELLGQYGGDACLQAILVVLEGHAKRLRALEKMVNDLAEIMEKRF